MSLISEKRKKKSLLFSKHCFNIHFQDKIYSYNSKHVSALNNPEKVKSKNSKSGMKFL